MLPETYPKDRYSPQSHVSYELTDQDLLPSEILREFKSDRVRSIKSIYNLISRYKLDRPVQAKKYLQKLVLAACPEEVGFEDWEKVYEEKIEYVRAEALSRLWKRIGKHESLWAEE
jgi:two-component sensor histidine kinase